MLSLNEIEKFKKDVKEKSDQLHVLLSSMQQDILNIKLKLIGDKIKK